MKDLRVATRALLAEPLWHVSLGSKELFHSNLLAWMCERFPGRARLVLTPWLRADPICVIDRVRREDKHLDLVIEFAGYAPLVIENKMFSLPDEDQLARYSTGALVGMPPNSTMVLLGPTDPGWEGGTFEAGGRTWTYVSYVALAERLASEFDPDQGFDGAILAHEAQLIELLTVVINGASITSSHESLTVDAEAMTVLREAHLDDALGKIRAHQVMRRINTAYRELNLTLTTARGAFTNSSPVLEAFWTSPSGDSVGWQYQAGQWRLAMILETMSGRTPESVAARSDYAASRVDWFDFAPLAGALQMADADLRPTRSRTDANGFNKYDPSFVYRYRRVPDRLATVTNLTALATIYGQRAQQWQFSNDTSDTSSK